MCDRKHLKHDDSDVTIVGFDSREFIKATLKTQADLAAGRISPTEARAINARHRAVLKALELSLKWGRR